VRDLQKICGSKVGIIVNNKFTTICVFLSYSYVFNDVTVKDILLKVFFYCDHAKLLFSFRFKCDNKQDLELGMQWAINIPTHYV